MSIAEQINTWKAQRQAVILAHNYQRPEVQVLADFTGDSLELARKAADLDAPVIIFCGVTFMAETAAALNPGKQVIMPDATAGCPMADMITGADVRALREKHPNHKILCYVNSSLEVKAECDCCCTSSNAYRVAKHYTDAGYEIIFVPDQHLGGFTADRLGKEFVLWPGYCPTHARLTPAQIATARAAHPEAKLMVHPECPKDIRDSADYVLSTGEMCREARESTQQSYLIGTEVGILHRLQTENPGKQFYPIRDDILCPNMKKTTPENLLHALQTLETPVQVEPLMAERARHAIEAMLAIG